MIDDPLGLSAEAASAIVDDVRFHGRRGVESGSILLTRRGERDVQLVAIAGERGITRRHGLFMLSSSALNPLFDLAEDYDLQLRAQVHSHGGEAFLSRTDRAGNIRLPGFIASVIPNFADPPKDVASWGWWVFTGEDWAPADPATPSAATPRVVTFDADGIHDR